MTKINSLVDTKSRSIIRIDPNSKKMPLHSDVIRYLIKEFPYAIQKVGDVLNSLNEDKIMELLNCYSDELLPQTRKDLLSLYLSKKISLLDRIRSEACNE